MNIQTSGLQTLSKKNIFRSFYMGKQTTIAKTVHVSGIGLHTGNMTTVEFKPAEPNTGIIFVRNDIAERPYVRASVEHVLDVTRGTTIGKGNMNVHTVEHLLAACYALGIDNLIIHMDSNEPPVGDGSSLMFVEMLEQAGVVEHTVERSVLKITEPVRYESGLTVIEARPYDKEGLRITGELLYNHPLIQHQKACFEIVPEIFKKEIAPARTFCFDYEIEAIKKKGLAKGGSLNNAVVIGIDQIHCNGSLRFPDEFVRHKILDLIGDLSLLSLPLCADIYAKRSGHGHNINFTRKIHSVYSGV